MGHKLGCFAARIKLPQIQDTPGNAEEHEASRWEARANPPSRHQQGQQDQEPHSGGLWDGQLAQHEGQAPGREERQRQQGQERERTGRCFGVVVGLGTSRGHRSKFRNIEKGCLARGREIPENVMFACKTLKFMECETA